MSSKPVKRGRIRAHAHPLAISNLAVPTHPYQYDWQPQYPKLLPPKENSNELIPPSKNITILDVGSGFGGMLLSLSDHFHDELILGIEIRTAAVEITNQDINEARQLEKVTCPNETVYDWDARNIAVLNTNIMKYAPNYFMKGQLNKMFILFADPHFKNSKHRLRVISPTLLDIYAYILSIGGILYTITDVEDLYLWQKKHLDQHPLFEFIPNEELEKKDICYDLLFEGTGEGVKVTKAGGNKYPACYRRVEYNPQRIQQLGVEKTRVGLLE